MTDVASAAGLSGYGVGTRAGAGDMVEVDGGEFNYDEKVMVETSQERGMDFTIRPIGAIVNTRPKSQQTFVIEPLVDKYLQNNRTRLETRLRVTKGNGDTLSPLRDVVAPANLLGVLMWESVVVKVNGQEFHGKCNTASGIKAYIDTILSTEDDARHTHAQTQMLHMDTPGAYDDFGMSADEFASAVVHELEQGNVNPFPPDLLDKRQKVTPPATALTADQLAGTFEFPYTTAGGQATVAYIKRADAIDWIMEEARAAGDVPDGQDPVIRTMARVCEIDRSRVRRNKGFEQRLKMARFSEEFNLVSPIPHDFFNLNNHIGPGNRIEIILTPAMDSFVLNTYLSHEPYVLEIVDMKLHLRTIERKERIHPPLVERYRMNQTELQVRPVSPGMTTFGFRVHHGGVQPKTLVFAFNDTRAIQGDYTRNPVQFSHFNLRRIQLNINGEIVPSGGLNFDFRKKNPHCVWGYEWLFENTGALLTNRGNMITMNQFMTGAFLIPFDLTPDHCNGVHNHKADYGYIDVELEWDSPLGGPVTVLCEKVFPQLVVNDKLNSQLTQLHIEA